jgi:hypothetical protein
LVSANKSTTCLSLSTKTQAPWLLFVGL